MDSDVRLQKQLHRCDLISTAHRTRALRGMWALEEGQEGKVQKMAKNSSDTCSSAAEVVISYSGVYMYGSENR